MSKIERSWINNAAKKQDMLEYQNWFDSCNSLDECVKKGYIDFAHRIFTQDFYKIIGDPRDKKCLEIGCGGGRLLNAACKFFKLGYGIDILEQKSFNKTAEFIIQGGSKNFSLQHRDDIKEISDNSIDFVYSFIVFQHFNSWEEAEKYLDFIKRVLKPGGAGILYFGLNKTNDQDILVTQDKDFSDRECSLYVSRRFIDEEISKRFLLLEMNRGTKQLWSPRESGQFLVKFKARD